MSFPLFLSLCHFVFLFFCLSSILSSSSLITNSSSEVVLVILESNCAFWGVVEQKVLDGWDGMGGWLSMVNSLLRGPLVLIKGQIWFEVLKTVLQVQLYFNKDKNRISNFDIDWSYVFLNVKMRLVFVYLALNYSFDILAYFFTNAAEHVFLLRRKQKFENKRRRWYCFWRLHILSSMSFHYWIIILNQFTAI